MKSLAGLPGIDAVTVNVTTVPADVGLVAVEDKPTLGVGLDGALTTIVSDAFPWLPLVSVAVALAVNVPAAEYRCGTAPGVPPRSAD